MAELAWISAISSVAYSWEETAEIHYGWTWNTDFCQICCPMHKEQSYCTSTLFTNSLPDYSPFVFLLFKMWIRKQEKHLIKL